MISGIITSWTVRHFSCYDPFVKEQLFIISRSGLFRLQVRPVHFDPFVRVRHISKSHYPIKMASIATKFRPLFDRVLVKRLDAVKQSKGGIMLPESAAK
ncbi:PREDICTED: uncharacterized protein LOC107165289, partial [Diuraphis noxia]|uniref:uncharacterized protein LOC107165289 n=1 Tax=Diuraphis noxia TaxID=143948 RepID=UPI0007636C89